MNGRLNKLSGYDGILHECFISNCCAFILFFQRVPFMDPSQVVRSIRKFYGAFITENHFFLSCGLNHILIY